MSFMLEIDVTNQASTASAIRMRYLYLRQGLLDEDNP
ncbi:Hypothetical protein Cp106_0819 [Corynebacterium pseudotuberculosis 1/06-A]|nr:Hypothetical protein Cp106_0819 [Corynebacterium pseudotuberculosis 1/06-A]